MSDKPLVVRPPEPDGWTVYRIATKWSSYHLAVYHGGRGRQVAVLLGVSGDRKINQAETDPLVGGRLLFHCDPSEWVGHPLEIGKVRTTAIEDARRETNPMVVRAITEAAAAILAEGGNKRLVVENITGETDIPRRMAPSDFPYPEDNVIRLESAAHFLGAVCDRQALVHDLESFPELMERFQVALMECLVKVNELGGRVTSRR